MIRLRVVPAAAVAVGLAACAPAEPSQPEDAPVRFVALGDSYTIGISVEADERWPNQLVARVEGLELVANLGMNGYTSADVIAHELPRIDELRPGFVTLLIGANDVVQGVSPAQYAGNVERILDTLLERLPPDRILCVATPDYTRTPQGDAFGDPDQQAAAIVEANDLLREACDARRIRFVPGPYEVSLEVDAQPALVSSDGLHPSGEQYRRWTDAIAPVVEELLGG